MNFLLFVTNLFILLPVWAACLVLAGLAMTVVGAAVWLVWRLKSIPGEMAKEMSAGFAEASATVHSVAPAPRPQGPSAFDMDPNDEDYNEEFDGPQVWAEEGDYYWIDVTLTPSDPEFAWSPGSLHLYPADFEGEVGDASERMGPLHTAELFGGSRFLPIQDRDVQFRGSQRLRLLMAAPDDKRRARFNYAFRCFGDAFALPAPLPQPSGSSASRPPGVRR